MIDIEYLKKTVSRRNKHDKMWQQAFKEFNAEMGLKLGMVCAPCYYKVLMFHLKKQQEKVSA